MCSRRQRARRFSPSTRTGAPAASYYELRLFRYAIPSDYHPRFFRRLYVLSHIDSSLSSSHLSHSPSVRDEYRLEHGPCVQLKLSEPISHYWRLYGVLDYSYEYSNTCASGLFSIDILPFLPMYAALWFVIRRKCDFGRLRLSIHPSFFGSILIIAFASACMHD
jgi:hypothetical protein